MVILDQLVLLVHKVNRGPKVPKVHWAKLDHQDQLGQMDQADNLGPKGILEILDPKDSLDLKVNLETPAQLELKVIWVSQDPPVSLDSQDQVDL